MQNLICFNPSNSRRLLQLLKLLLTSIEGFHFPVLFLLGTATVIDTLRRTTPRKESNMSKN